MAKCVCFHGQEVTDKVETPMVAFSGDTTIDFIHEPAAADAMRAELLIVECSFIDDTVSVADARRRYVDWISCFIRWSLL